MFYDQNEVLFKKTLSKLADCPFTKYFLLFKILSLLLKFLFIQPKSTTHVRKIKIQFFSGLLRSSSSVSIVSFMPSYTSDLRIVHLSTNMFLFTVNNRNIRESCDMLKVNLWVACLAPSN